MTKSVKPLKDKPKHKNHKDLFVWTAVLLALLFVAGAVLWGLRSAPESNVNIPETAFEKKPTRSAETRIANTASPALNSGSRERDENSPERSPELAKAMELVDQGHWDQAEPILLAELERNPRDEAILLELAMIQILDKHELAAAQPYLETAIRINPKNDAAVEELLGVYEEGQNWDQALRFFESLPPDAEGRGFVNYGKGNALLSVGRNGEAVDVLRKAVYEDDNKAFTARDSLATAYESLGRYDEASKEYEQVISGPYKPEQIRLAKIRLADNYANQKNFDQARAILEPLIAAEPKDRYAARVLEQVNNRERRQ